MFDFAHFFWMQSLINSFHQIKKHMKKPNRIALWMDSASARFFIPYQDLNSIQTLFSGIESQLRLPGETPNGTHWDNRSSSNEFRKDQREKELYKRYFDEIRQVLVPYSEILVLGPGQIKKELKNKLLKSNFFKLKTITVENAGTLSDRDFADWADRYFSTLDAGKTMISEPQILGLNIAIRPSNEKHSK